MENTTTMTTEMAFDTMEKLLPHLAAVINDPEIREAVDFTNTDEGRNTPVLEVLPSMLPLFITRHREDMLHIVAAIRGVTLEEARALPVKEMIAAMRSSFLGDMLMFAMLCLRMVNVQ